MTNSADSNERRSAILALVTHDEKKGTLTDFCVRHREALEGWELIATGSTGEQISEATDLAVQCYVAGPKGGDAQIAARVALGEVAAVIFLVDPLNTHSHDPDIQTLQRVCNVHNVPIATNVATAELFVPPRGPSNIATCRG